MLGIIFADTEVLGSTQMTWRLLGILHPDAELGALLGVLHPEAELGAAPRIYGAEAVSDNTKGLALAVASSAFIGGSLRPVRLGWFGL